MKLSFHFGLIAALVACSGEMDQPEQLEATEAFDSNGSPEPVSTADEEPFVPRTADELEAEFLQLLATPLPEQERAIVEEALIARGEDLNQTRIVGRMIIRDDVYSSVDDILHDATAIDKGMVRSDVSRDYARMNGAILEMRKPYFGRYGNIKIVVPSAAVRTIMNQAVSAVANAADDCITTSTFSVILQSEWDALQVGQADYPSIRVVYGPEATACPGDEDIDSSDITRGCARSPSFYGMRLPNNTTQVRFGVGFRIGLNSAVVTNTPDGVGTATHELLHALTIAHPYVEYIRDNNNMIIGVVPKIVVPGTAGDQAPTSIMNVFGNSNRSNTMSADDILTLDTIYSPPPGLTCAFPTSYEPTCAASCTKVSAVSVANQCCWCGGGSTPKLFVRSTFNANTYLCQ